MVAENDATTDAVKRVYEVARAAGSAAELIVYPPFKPSAAVSGSAPGHGCFNLKASQSGGETSLCF